MKNMLVFVGVLMAAFMLQTALVSRITLMSASADLILVLIAAWALQEPVRYAWAWGAGTGLLMGAISGAPWFIYVAGYLLVVGMARGLTKQIWQAPLLAMFAVTFVGTLIINLMMYVNRTLFEVPLPFGDVFSRIILPSVLINLLFSVMVHPLMRDLAGWLYAKEANR